MRIDEKIEDKKAELRAAAKACAEAAYLAADMWRSLGDRYMDGEPPEAIDESRAAQAAAAYMDALEELRRRRTELTVLATERRKVLNR